MTILPGASYRFYLSVRRSIAFVPSVIALIFLVSAFVINAIEYSDFVVRSKEAITFALVADIDTARTVLAILIGGLISLTVFSFSMVMLSINQASASLSPAVVPSLIADPLRQRILGVYLGTIIFYLMLTTNIRPASNFHDIPQLGILIAYLMATVCLALFIYFISSMSRSLQVDTILQDLYDQTILQIREQNNRWQQLLKDNQQMAILPETNVWSVICTNCPGYFKSINQSQVIDIMEQHDISIVVQLRFGEFTVSGQALARVSKPLDDETTKLLQHSFVFFMEEYAKDHYSFGIKQISQIGVKALSPGINDPMTAIKCIQLLSLLFIEVIKMGEFEAIGREESGRRCYIPEYCLEDLISIAFSPLCKYSQGDAQTVIVILNALKNIVSSTEDKHAKKMLLQFARHLIPDINCHISNITERESINRQIAHINQLVDDSGALAINFLATK